MLKNLLKGSFVGAIILYIWMTISWMVLPWHCSTMNTFSNENAVASTLMQNTQKSGLYILPNFCGTSKEEMSKKSEAMKKGPFAFVSILKEGYRFDSPRPYICAFIIDLIAALIVTVLILAIGHFLFWRKVLLITLLGLFASFAALLPAWNWWGFSFSYVFIGSLDLVIGWFLAGLGIAAVVKR